MTHEIVYRESHHSPEVYTVIGRLGKPDRLGFVPVIVKGKIVARPHWIDIAGYFPAKGGGFF